MCVESENVVSKIQGGRKPCTIKKKRQYTDKNIKQHYDEI